MLGTTLLNGRGEVLTFGGQVIKNVAGYDLSRVLAGSLGVLGIVCEVSLKVLPIPVATATLVFALNEAAALATWRTLANQPLPLDAGAWHSDVLHLRLSGARSAVRAACERLGGQRMDDDDARRWWLCLRDQTHAFFIADEARHATGQALWRLSVPPSAPPAAAARGPS